jgi:hypothetical protein
LIVKDSLYGYPPASSVMLKTSYILVMTTNPGVFIAKGVFTLTCPTVGEPLATVVVVEDFGAPRNLTFVDLAPG